MTKHFSIRFLKLFLFIAYSLISLLAAAQNNFALISYGTTTYYPREIFFGDTGETYITGQCSIRGSINNEVSWNGYCYTPLSIMGGCSPSLANTFVVGKSGLIRKNSACEIFGSWYDQYTGISDTLYSIKFFDINTGVTVGQNGRILRTNNNGRVWTIITSGTTASLRNLIIKPNHTLVACGANGSILQSPDSGVTWTSFSTGITNLLNDVSFPSNDTGYAAGKNGMMIKTTDGGSSWNSINTGITTTINAIDFSDANTGLFVGPNGLVKRTNDGGATWTVISITSSNEVFDVKFRNKQTAYLITTFEAFKSINGGVNWFNMGSDMNAVKYINDSTVFAVGDNTVQRSTDGGLSWKASYPSNSSIWYDFAFPTQDTGYICGSGGKIMKTTDRGLTFTPQVTNAPSSGGNYYFGMHFFDNNKGIAVGSQFMISRTNNGGQTWTTTYSSGSSGYGFYDVFFVNNQVGWVCGSGGNIRKSTDGGQTFTSQSSGTTKFLWNIYFLTPQKGFACGESGTLCKTTNGGATWTSSIISGNYTLYSIAFRDSLHGYISGDSQYLYETKDGGATWKYVNNSFTMKSMAFRTALKGVAVGPGNAKYYFDPIKVLNRNIRVCTGSSSLFEPKIASGVNIAPGNKFILEMDTTGEDFNDALYLGAKADTAYLTYFRFKVPKNLKNGTYKARVRTTGTTPVNKSMVGNMTVCDEPEAELTLRNDTLFTPYNPKYLYRWRLNNIVIPGANSYYYVPSGPGNYWVDVYFGCCYDAYDKINLTSCAGGFLVEPLLDNTYALICDSSSAILTARGAQNYHWYDSDTSSVVIGNSATFITPVLYQRDTFYVASYNDSCESNRIPIDVQFTNRPNPVTAIGDSVCAGTSAYLISNYGGSSTSWFADSIGGSAIQETASLQVPNLLVNDTFYVSISNYQCESKRTPVIAYALDAPLAGTISGDTTVSIGDTSAYYYSATQGNTIKWFVSGGQLLTTNDSLLVKWDSTLVAKVGVIESNYKGCRTDTLWLNVHVDLAIGVAQNKVKVLLSISPNPAFNKILVERLTAATEMPLTILSAEGKIVLSTYFPRGKTQLSLDVSHLAAGTYSIQYGAGIAAEGKFIIIR